VVKVPVLSTHITLTFAIVSQASNFLTKLLSFTNFLAEYEIAITTDKSNPSGIPTTKIVIYLKKKKNNVFYFHNKQKKYNCNQKAMK